MFGIGGGGDPGPQVVTRSFRAGPATVGLPRGARQPAGQLIYPDAGAAGVDAHPPVAADGQDVADTAGFEIAAQAGIGAVHLVAGHPPGRCAAVECRGNHLPGRRRFGGEAQSGGYSGPIPAVGVSTQLFSGRYSRRSISPRPSGEA